METTNDIHITPPSLLVKMGALALGMLALFLLVLTVSAWKSYHFIGEGIQASNTITVSGSGDVVAVPDTAEFSYSVTQSASDVTTAQNKVSKAGNDILAYLKDQGIADTDVQTTDYSVNPQYSYSQASCPVTSMGSTVVYCPPGKQTLTGYEVSETVSVKVKDTSKAGSLLAGIGSKGATNVSGLNLTVSNQKDLTSEAQAKAIADARTKADALAHSLGVSIVRVVGFSENGSSPVPMYAKAMDSMAGSAAVAPTIAVGQNKITSNVSVTYAIQ